MCNLLCMKYIRKVLMLAVFATTSMSVCKYAKYESVRCQENSIILTTMIWIRSIHMSSDRKVTFLWIF